LLALFFGEVLLAPNVYYPGDTARQYLPARLALAQALRQGRLPWWRADLGLGYPLLAEGEVGALYPLNWLLVGLLPPLIALNLSVVLHVCLAGWGAYLAARRSGRSHGGALIGAMTFALGGFVVAHRSHLSILTVAAWLPWLFWLTEGLLAAEGSRARWRWAAGLAAATALQFLGGHPQIALLSLMAVGLCALASPWVVRRRHRWRSWLAWGAALALGGLLAWPQLGPTLELSALSQRAGGLDAAYFTSYSFHPLLLSTFLSPFILGNPYPNGSVELMAYAGLLPLLLAWLALGRRGGEAPARHVWFWLALATLGLLLALGRWNPAYALLRHVPVLNLLRVPARYLLWTSYALAMLAGIGYDRARASARAVAPMPRPWLALGAAALLGGGVMLALLATQAAARGATETTWATAANPSLADVPIAEALVALWRWLPLPLALLAALTVWLLPRQRPGVALALALGCLVVDLYAYSTVLDRTYNATWPRAAVARPISAVEWLARDAAGAGDFRVYTKEEILPDLAVARGALYPNMALGTGIASANLYMPLAPRAYQETLAALTARTLDQLNVRYVLIPQLLPVDAASELYDVENPFSALPYDAWQLLPQIKAVGIEVESYLSHAAALPDGALAATVRLRHADGAETALPLRAGIETAEWAYDRPDVRAQVAHARPEIAHTFPARSGYPPEEHPGYVYRAAWALAPGAVLSGIRIEPALDPAFARIERLWLLTADGERLLLNHLAGLGDHSIVYRSEDVLIYRNHDALPRAYWLPAEFVCRTEEGHILPGYLLGEHVRPVSVDSYTDTEVRLRAELDQTGYVILADLYYPGWRATVDGAPAEILPVDGLYRGLRLEPGAHQIVLTYRPAWGLTR
jgi:hypothetical protein